MKEGRKAGKQAGEYRRMMKFFRLSYLVHSQIWLNLLMDDDHFNLHHKIAKKKKKKKRIKGGKKKKKNPSMVLSELKKKEFITRKPNLVWPEKLTVNATQILLGCCSQSPPPKNDRV
jgi:hypothetical protein